MIDRRGFFGILLGGGMLGGASATQAAPPQVPSLGQEDLPRLTLEEVSVLLARGEITSMQLVEACLDRIRRDSVTNAFITVLEETARDRARMMDAELSNGRNRGALHGVPIAIKDNIDVAGVRGTAASRIYEHRVAQRDATVYARLREAGAVLIGKLNMGELATCELASAWGGVRNPIDPQYEAGGSSGGAAAALAASFCYGTVGTDTSGSIRIPASHCGVVGFKPSFGFVDQSGVMPNRPILDHVGPLARTVKDTAILFHHMTGSHRVSLEDFDTHAKGVLASVRPIRIGVDMEYRSDCDPEVRSSFEKILDLLHRPHFETSFIRLPPNDWSLYSKTSVEFYSYYRSNIRSRYKDLQRPNQIYYSAFESAVNGYDVAADYFEALQRVSDMRNQQYGLPANIDFCITPTVKYRTRKFERVRRLEEAGELYREPPRTATVNFNLNGLPAISIPFKSAESEMPIGVQIVANASKDASLLYFAAALEGLIQDAAPT